MHILHVISGLDVRSGGPVAAVAGLARSQKNAGLEVTVFTTWKGDVDLSISDALRADGVNVHIVGPTKTPLNWHAKIKPTLNKLINECDIVHIHAVWEPIQHQAACIARKLNRPYIITPHGMLTTWALGQRTLKKRLYLALRGRRNLNAASTLHFTTNAEREGSASARVTAPSIVESLGVELDEFKTLPAPGTFRKQFPIIGDRKLIVFLGRIHPGKGLEYLIPALGKMNRQDVILAVVGPDSRNFKAVIEQQIDEYNLRDQVLFAGMLKGSQRIEALADADLFALPSDHENFGIVVVEALAAGTPVVISDQVNIQDTILAGNVGGVIPQDIGKLADELNRWLDDDDMRKCAAEKSRPFVWEHYDWNNIAKRWVDRYKHFIA